MWRIKQNPTAFIFAGLVCFGLASFSQGFKETSAKSLWKLADELDKRNKLEPRAKVDVTCDLCVNVANNFISMLEGGSTIQEVIDMAVDLCQLGGFGDEFDCHWEIESQAPTMAWVAQNGPNFNLEKFCAEYFYATDCSYQQNPEEWVIDLPTPKPPVERPQIPEGLEGGMKILHISDFHVDPLYEEGSESKCDKRICCQSVNGPAVNDPAGIFGSYNACDSPWITLEETFKHIAETHPDIELIFYTGDTVAHDVWQQSMPWNLDVISTAQELLNSYLPNTKFTVFGNHDPYPADVFSFKELDVPADLSTGPLYEQAWSQWQQWLPADQEDNVVQGGYYSTSPIPGLKIIGINNMLGHFTNLFMFSGVPDPSGQLSWLVNELQMAEDNGEKVYILGHVPPGQRWTPFMDPTWDHNFFQIVNRYESTIRGLFYGHTHNDEFRIFFNEDGEPSSVGFVSPSVTTLFQLNSGYRVIYVDGNRGEDSTWEILDHETWVFDLEEANESGSPNWYKSYSMREEYQLPDLTPGSMLTFTEALKSNETVFQTYYRHYSKEYSNGSGCDEDCKKALICATLSADINDDFAFCGL